MNLIRRSKKSTDVTQSNFPSASAESPLNEIGDVSAVAVMFDRLRQQNAQYDQAIAALVAANRIKDGWDKPAEPEMSLTIQREVLVGLGETFLSRDWALRAVFVLAGLGHLALVGYARREANSETIAAAEAACFPPAEAATEQEFVDLIGSRKTYKPRNLQAAPEQLARFAETNKPPVLQEQPAAPASTSYPPLPQ